MANIVDFSKIGTSAYPNTFVRGGAFSLDQTSLWSSYEAAAAYARADGKSYKGQLLTVAIPNEFSDWVFSDSGAYTLECNTAKAEWTLTKSDKSTLVVSGVDSVLELTFGEGDSAITATRTLTKAGSVKTYKIDENSELVQIDGEVIVDVNVDPADGKVYATVPVKSADPSKWIQSNKTEGYFNSLTYGNGKFVAAGGSIDGGIWYSTNGIDWSSSDCPEVPVTSIIYADGKFVAASSGEGIYYSTDGSEWIQSNITEGFWNSLTYGDGKFVSGGDGIYYSTNGIDWIQSNKTDGSFRSLTYADGKFVACIDAAEGIWYSTNGSEWIQSNKTDGYYSTLVYVNGNFFASGGIDNHYTSSDGINWYQTGMINYYINDLIYVNGKYIAASDDGILVADSINYLGSEPVISGNFNSVIYADGKFVAGSRNNGIYYSTDGSEWTQTNKTEGYFKLITYADGKFVAASTNTDTGIWYSASIETDTIKKQLAYQEDLERAVLGDLSVALERIDAEIDGLKVNKADKSYVDTELGKKADKATTESELAKKLDKTTAESDYLKKTDAANAYTVAVTSANGEGAVLKKYTITQGENSFDINIPKDLVVTEGKLVIAGDGTEGTEVIEDSTAGDKYLKLTIGNSDKPVYIKVTDLVDVYTGDNNGKFNVNIDNNNVITVELSGDIFTDEVVIRDSIEGVDSKIVTVQDALIDLYTNKRDKDDSIAHSDSEVFTDWVFTSRNSEVQELFNKNPPTVTRRVDGWYISYSGGNFDISMPFVSESADATLLESYGYLNGNEDDSIDITATRSKVKVAKAGESYVSQSYVDTKSTEALTEAKAYADSKSTADLAATKKYTDDKIAELDGSATIASVADGVVTIKAGITETDGKVSQGTGADITLAKVATTGKAEDISISDAEGKITATTVEGALTELVNAIDSHHTVMTAGDTAGTIKYGDEGCGDNYQTVAVPYKDGENLGEAVTRIDEKTKTYLVEDGKTYTVVSDKVADPSKWTQSNQTYGSFNSIIYADGKFVAVSDGNYGIYYSTNGIEWTPSNITYGYFTSVTYGNNIFVASDGIGEYGIWYSTDGIEWNQSNKTDGSFNSIIYADGKFVATVGEDGGIWYSTNGSEWTQSNKTNGSFGSITYGNGKFVVGSYGLGIWYSTDGITWTQSNKTNESFYSVAYGNGKFVAVGDEIGIWYSTDGITWTQSNKTNKSFYSVAYGNGKFVACGVGIWYSTNGSEWIQSNKTDGYFSKITYANDKFLARGSGLGIWYSTDGIDWTQSNKTNKSFYSVAYGNGKFVAGSDGDGIWYSNSIESTDKKQLAYKDYVDTEIQKLNADLDSTKRDKDDNIVTKDSEVFSGWVWSCDDPIVQDHLNNNNVKIEYTYYTDEQVESGASNHWYLTTNPELNGYEFNYNSNDLPLDDSNSLSVEFYNYVTKLSDSSKLSITATRSKIKVAKAGESYVSQSYVDTKSTEAKTTAVSESKKYVDEKVTKIYLGTTTTNLINNDVSTIKINGSDAIAATGSMAMYNGELYIWTGSKWEAASKHSTEVANKVDKTTTIAGIDLQDNITKNEMLTALNVEDGAQVNKIEVIKIGGVALTITNKTVDIDNLILDGGSAS